MLLRKYDVKKQNIFLEKFQIFQRTFFLSRMTTRNQKRKAVEKLVSVDQETPLSGNNQSENLVAGTSKSPKFRTENLEEMKSTLRKKVLSDLTKILAENQKEMLKLMAPVIKKRATLTVPGETDSESESVPIAVTSKTVKAKTTGLLSKLLR